MRTGLLDWPSLAKAFAVHLILAAIFLFGWEASSPDIKAQEIPPHVKAVVVERPKPVTKKPTTKKPAPKKPVKKKEPKKEKPKPKPKQKPKPKEKPKPKPKPKPEKKVEVKKPKGPSFDDLFAEETKELQKEEKEQERKKALAEQQRIADEKQRLELEKQQAEEAERIASELDTFKSLIQQTMKRYWKQPPVARDNLVVKLNIRLFPGGEVNQVKVIESSGNAAFDRSAETAVIKAGRFSVPSDPALFDKHFRSFIMIFNPNEI